jgi:ABC-type multidrug transport system fused ATPase/permease subunit
LRDFDLTVPAGQKVGLVGKSGAGKSTITSLIVRAYDVLDGDILIDGQNIALVTQDSLRQHITVVTQESYLFHRSIKDNIIYGNLDADMDSIVAVAKKANAHDFIMQLEDNNGRKGYEAHVGERGVKLSGGQKQRVGIARAILKDAPILILDEATSALDSESEHAIQSALESIMVNKTVIAIAHRLSTLRQMDRIIVMEEGHIVEDGTHDQLIRKPDGSYAKLWSMQSGGFLKEEPLIE